MGKVNFLLLALLVAAHFNTGECAKILMYMGMSTPSHKFAFLTYVNGLLDRGHDVTFISPHPTKGAKFRDIVPTRLQDTIRYMSGPINFMDLRLRNDMWTYWKVFPKMSYDTCKALLDSPEVEDIVTGKEKFDLVVMDNVVTECGMGLQLVTKAPLMYYSTTVLLSWNTAAFGLPPLGLYKTSTFTFYDRDVRNFWDRMSSTMANTLYDWQRNWMMFPAVEDLWAKKLGRPVPPFFQIEKNMSLMLLNTHPLVDFSVPYTANVIPIGGIHFLPLKTLPKDLEEFASGSGDNGFVLVSLGSIVQSKTLPEKYYKAFVEAFTRLPYRIIWKWEDEALSKKLPPNVMIKNWLPQHELLAHPNIRGFVCHGGKLGFLESTKEGVPLVVIPFFADQDIHARKVVEAGVGVHLDLIDVTADKLYNAISTIVTDSSYKQKAAKRAQMLNDQPDTPLERAIYWTEYVLRHPEGPDSRPQCTDFWWFQYHMIDIWLVISVVILAPVIAAVLLVRCLLRKSHETKSKKVKSS